VVHVSVDNRQMCFVGEGECSSGKSEADFDMEMETPA